MPEHTPDRWVVVKIVKAGQPTVYKVMAGWYGGYLGSDYWQLNSGIAKMEDMGSAYLFYGRSGSLYLCPKGAEGTTGLTASVLSNMIEHAKEVGVKVEIVDAATFIQETKSV